MSLLHLDDNNFQKEILEGEKPAMVDFYTTWCGPCKIVSPIIEELAEEYKGRFKVAKVNVEEAQNVATKYSIMSVPTLLFFKAGRVIDQVVGVLSKQQLKIKMDKFLA
ncbi:MAG: thioredoxin [Candidatus Omnitrophica bacterium]|nr:thioredoxin [Candidatus Omnitrophota bacterium]